MKIISANSKEIVGRRKQFYTEDAISINEKGIHFSKSLCVVNGIHSGDCLFFINDGADWRFYVDNDSGDGFILVDDEKKRGGLYIFNNGLLKMIKKSLGIGETSVYKVVKTILEQRGHEVYWIMTQKKIERKKKETNNK